MVHLEKRSHGYAKSAIAPSVDLRKSAIAKLSSRGYLSFEGLGFNKNGRSPNSPRQGKVFALGKKTRSLSTITVTCARRTRGTELRTIWEMKAKHSAQNPVKNALAVEKQIEGLREVTSLHY